MHKKIFREGQGAIEYLLIIGAAILVTAVVIIATSQVLTQGRMSVDVNELQKVSDPLQEQFNVACSIDGEEVCNLDRTYKTCINKTWTNFDVTIDHCGVTCINDGFEDCNTSCNNPGTKEFTCNDGSKTYSPCIATNPECPDKTCKDYLTLQNCTTEGCFGTTTTAQPGEICITDSFEKKFADGNGTTISPYGISTCTQLQNISFALDKNFIILNDFSCNSIPNFSPITNFSGKLNGNKRTISNFTSNGTGARGVFSSATNALITDLNFTNHKVTGGVNTGGLVGYCTNCTIRNIQISGDVNLVGDGYAEPAPIGGIVGSADSTTSIDKSKAIIKVTKAYTVGGIAGYSAGTITNSFADINFTGLSYVAGFVGGIVGYLAEPGSIKNCHTKGIIKVTNNAGSLGGIVGTIQARGVAPTIQNSYSDVNISCISGCSNYSGGIAGRVRNTQAVIINTFSTGTLSGGKNEGGKICVGGEIGYLSSSLTNPNNHSTFTPCFGCSKSPQVASCTIDTNRSNYYDSTHLVYTNNIPVWNDGNWVWQAGALPKLSWE